MDKHSRFEKARIIGSRALQISMGAPVSIDVPEDTIDPVLIAQMEYDQEVIPITVIARRSSRVSPTSSQIRFFRMERSYI